MRTRELLKKIIPVKWVHWVRARAADADRHIIKLFAGFRFLSGLYYLVFSREFGREQQAVLKGRIAYWRSLKNIERSSALLRRNTHRLEKGLIMKPRRPSFAADYIGETVDCFREALLSTSIERRELKWANDVLHAYFDVVTDTPKIAKARTAWEQLKVERADGTSIPYPHQQLPKNSITTEELHTLFRRRRSVRWFTETKVSREAIEQAFELASLAPSACNRQPYEFYVVQDSQRAAKIAGMAGGTVGFSEQIGQVIVVVGDLQAYPMERDRHCIYIDGSLATMQLMLAFETMGVSTCPINWPDIEFRERLLENELKLSPHQRPIMLLAFGYADADGGIPYSAKKSSSILGRFIDDER